MTSGLDVKQFREDIIRPTLFYLDMYSMSAETLLLGTAIQESLLCYIRQLGSGPALGLYQMEPATHTDIWLNYLGFRPELKEKMEDLLAPFPSRIDQLQSNLFYATAMARLHYYRVSMPLPEPDDIGGMAAYWKDHYNTELGAGSVQEFIDRFNNFV
jgi:hypothetical protein